MSGLCLAVDSKPSQKKQSVRLELYADSQKNCGGRLMTPLFEFRAAGSSASEKLNSGFLLTSRNYFSKLPFSLKYGNLSVSGSLARLNSPELSNGSSPFSDGIIPVSGLSASLPGYTSFSKPESCFLEISANKIFYRPQTFSFNLWASPENDSAIISTLLSDKFFSKQLTLSASWTAGQFHHNDNSTSSWFSNSPYYSAGSDFASLLQLAADYKSKKRKTGFYSSFMAAIYESPFGPYTVAMRADFKINIKQNEFFTSAFLNAYEDILTSSEKKLDPCCQFKTGIISSKSLLIKDSELIFVKLALNAFSRINFTKSEHPVRINTGIQFSNDLNILSISISGTGLFISDTPEVSPNQFKKDAISIQVKNSWYFNSFIPALTLSAEIRNCIKYKIQLNMTNNAKSKISGSLNYSFTSKDGEASGKKLTSSVNCRFNHRQLIMIGKASVSFDF